MLSLTFNSLKACWHSRVPSIGPLVSPFKVLCRHLAISPKHGQRKPAIPKNPWSCYLLHGTLRANMGCIPWGDKVWTPRVSGYPRYWTHWEVVWAFGGENLYLLSARKFNTRMGFLFEVFFSTWNCSNVYTISKQMGTVFKALREYSSHILVGFPSLGVSPFKCKQVLGVRMKEVPQKASFKSYTVR